MANEAKSEPDTGDTLLSKVILVILGMNWLSVGNVLFSSCFLWPSQRDGASCSLENGIFRIPGCGHCGG